MMAAYERPAGSTGAVLIQWQYQDNSGDWQSMHPEAIKVIEVCCLQGLSSGTYTLPVSGEQFQYSVDLVSRTQKNVASGVTRTIRRANPCPTCTFLNDEAAAICAMCGNRLPALSMLPGTQPSGQQCYTGPTTAAPAEEPPPPPFPPPICPLDVPRTRKTEAEVKAQWAPRIKQVCDEGGTVALPPMNSFVRAVLHKMAEAAGLAHISEGEGHNRHIVLSKPDGAAWCAASGLAPPQHLPTLPPTAEVLPRRVLGHGAGYI